MGEQRLSWITDAYDRLWSRSEDFTAERHGLTILTCVPANCLGQVVAVRDEYLQLWDFLRNAHDGKHHGGLVLTGHTGIGKSFFLLYAFARALKEHIPVAYCDSPGEYYFCDGTGCRVYPTAHLVLHEMEPGKQFLALIDSSESVPIPPHPFVNRFQMCYTVQATSPRPDRYCRWAEKRRARFWIIGLWTEDEVRRLQYFYEQEGSCPWNDSDAFYTPLEVFSLLGPSAAECFAPDGNPKTAQGPAHDLHDLLMPEAVFDNVDGFLDAWKTGTIASPRDGPSFDRFFFASKAYNAHNPMRFRPQFHHGTPTPFLSRLLATAFRLRTTGEQMAFLAKLRDFPQATSFVYEPAILDALCASERPLTCHLVDGSTFPLGPGLTLASNQVDVDSTPEAVIAPRDHHIYVLRNLSPWITAFVISEDQTRVTMLQMTVAYRREIASSAVSAVIRLVQRSMPNTSAIVKWTFVFVSPGARGEATAKKLEAVKFRGTGYPAVGAGWLEVGGLLPLVVDVRYDLKFTDAEHLDQELDDTVEPEMKKPGPQ